MRRKKPRVVVFFGGQAGSHDLSEETGYWMCEHIPRSKYHVTPVKITVDGKWQVPLGHLPEFGSIKKFFSNIWQALPKLSPKKGLERLLLKPVDSMMTLVRGRGGDDGSIHGLGHSLGIPVVGSSLPVCLRTSDKHVCAQSLGDIACFPSEYRCRLSENSDELIDRVRRLYMPPFFVKPASQEGSVGVYEVQGVDELLPAVNAIKSMNEDVIIQDRSPGTEVCVTLFDDERGKVYTLQPTVVVPQGNTSYYDHLAKRRSGRVLLHTQEADSLNPLLKEAECIARDVYEELGCLGLVSFDLMAGEDSTELLEVNTVPTVTELTPLKQQLARCNARPDVFVDSLIRRSLD